MISLSSAVETDRKHEKGMTCNKRLLLVYREALCVHLLYSKTTRTKTKQKSNKLWLNSYILFPYMLTSNVQECYLQFIKSLRPDKCLCLGPPCLCSTHLLWQPVFQNFTSWSLINTGPVLQATCVCLTEWFNMQMS